MIESGTWRNVLHVLAPMCMQEVDREFLARAFHESVARL